MRDSDNKQFWQATVRMKAELSADTLRKAVSAAGPYTVLKVAEVSK